jgi:ABC-type branched-subunit amino acid transport system ATPase component
MTDALVVRDLSVHYGGLHAVRGVSLDAPLARLTGLIGPNGAGKTTTFNALSGLVRPSAGTISLFGNDISRMSPQARARHGLGRTFQRMELFDSLTVAQNVALGREAHFAGSNPLRHLVARSSERAAVGTAVDAAIELCDLGAIAHRRAGTISTGQRRLVELGRAVAGDFRILLLDEPSSGLDVAETQRFGAILRMLVSEGLGILLVEHDMALVMAVCDYIYVIDFGEPIFDGDPKTVAASPDVRAAYLGSESAA